MARPAHLGRSQSPHATRAPSACTWARDPRSTSAWCGGACARVQERCVRIMHRQVGCMQDWLVEHNMPPTPVAQGQYSRRVGTAPLLAWHLAEQRSSASGYHCRSRHRCMGTRCPAAHWFPAPASLTCWTPPLWHVPGLGAAWAARGCGPAGPCAATRRQPQTAPRAPPRQSAPEPGAQGLRP